MAYRVHEDFEHEGGLAFAVACADGSHHHYALHAVLLARLSQPNEKKVVGRWAHNTTKDGGLAQKHTCVAVIGRRRLPRFQPTMGGSYIYFIKKNCHSGPTPLIPQGLNLLQSCSRYLDDTSSAVRAHGLPHVGGFATQSHHSSGNVTALEHLY